MASIIKKLPDDLKRYITSYTYCPQNKELLNDIISYGETNKLLRQYISLICKQITRGDTHDGRIYRRRFYNTNKLFLKNWKLFTVQQRAEKLTVFAQLAHNPISVRQNNPLFVIYVLHDILWAPNTEYIQYSGWKRADVGPRRSRRQPEEQNITSAEWNSWVRKWCRPPSWTPALRLWKALAISIYPDTDWF